MKFRTYQRIAGIGILLAILFGMGGCICLIASGVRSDSPKPILLVSDHLNGKEGKFEVWLISQEAYSHAKRTFTQDYIDYLLQRGVAPEEINRSYLGKPLNIPIILMSVGGDFGQKVWTSGPWTIRFQDVVRSDSRCAHLEVMIKGYESHPFILEIIKDMDGPSANVFCLEVRRPEGNLYGTIEANILPAAAAINLRLEW